MSKGKADNKIGTLIRQIRLSRGMSQMALAEMLDISYQQVQKYEYGKSAFTISRLRQVASAMGVPVQTFIDVSPGVADNSYNMLSKEEIQMLLSMRKIKNERLLDKVAAVLKELIKMQNKSRQ